MSPESELRSGPRTEVFLAARVSTDGVKFERAVVTNLSPRGAYVEGEIDLPERARVLVDVVLAGVCVRLRARVAHPDEWPESARRIGLGVEFVSRTTEAVAALEGLLADPPAAPRLRETGEVSWPLDPPSGSEDSPSDAAGLSFMAAVNWEPVMAVSEEHGAVEEPPPGADLDAFRSWASALVPSLLAEEVDPIRMAYQGHCLGPAEGVPRAAFAEKAPEQVESMALQTVLIGLLREMDWRIERLDARHAPRLAAIASAYREAESDGFGARFPELLPFASQLDGLRQGWASLGVPGATRISAQRQVEDQDWISGGRGVAAPKLGTEVAKSAAKAPPPAPRSSEKSRASGWKKLLAFGLPGIVILGSVVYTALAVRAVDATDPLAEIGALVFVDLFDLEQIEPKGTTFQAVPEDWDDYEGSDLERRVSELCLRASHAGFTDAVLRSPEGRVLARCKGPVASVP